MEEQLIRKAALFAADAHRGQVRKYSGTPYMVHPAAVAYTVRTVTSNPHMIAAAYLHDVVEDTGVELRDIRRHFGERVARLVSDLTDVSVPEDGNRALRKAIDREHTAYGSPDAHTIKLADILDNLSDIQANDPWLAKVYMQEKMLLLPLLADGDSVLWARASKVVSDYYNEGQAFSS